MYPTIPLGELVDALGLEAAVIEWLHRVQRAIDVRRWSRWLGRYS